MGISSSILSQVDSGIHMHRIGDYLKKELSTLCNKSTEVVELNHSLLKFLPNEFHKHCKVGSFNNGNLIIITTDATWANQLRYLLPELRDRLRSEAHLYQLSSIKIKCEAEEQVSNSPKKTKLSFKSYKAILSEIETCQDPAIKKVLEKLASNYHKP